MLTQNIVELQVFNAKHSRTTSIYSALIVCPKNDINDIVKLNGD